MDHPIPSVPVPETSLLGEIDHYFKFLQEGAGQGLEPTPPSRPQEGPSPGEFFSAAIASFEESLTRATASIRLSISAEQPMAAAIGGSVLFKEEISSRSGSGTSAELQFNLPLSPGLTVSGAYTHARGTESLELLAANGVLALGVRAGGPDLFRAPLESEIEFLAQARLGGLGVEAAVNPGLAAEAAAGFVYASAALYERFWEGVAHSLGYPGM